MNTDDYRLDLKDNEINSSDYRVRPTDWPDLDHYRFSNEVPIDKSFEEMGLESSCNEYLDAGQDGQYLRYYCVQRAGGNHFLHQKSLVDLRSIPEHHDPEKLSAKLNIPYNIAYRLADAFKSLGIDRQFYLKIMKGDRGLEQASPVEILSIIESLTGSADEAEKVTVRWDNYMVVENVEAEYVNQYVKAIDMIDDELDESTGWMASNAFSTNRLFDSKEALSWEFQRKIETADKDELRVLKDGMFPRKRTSAEVWHIIMDFKAEFGTIPEYYSSHMRVVEIDGKFTSVPNNSENRRVSTGVLYDRPKYHYFTEGKNKQDIGMKGHFWKLYYRRRDELANETIPEDQLSADAQIAIGWIKSLGRGSSTTGIIYAASNGKNYSFYGIDVKFTTPLDQKEINTLWAIYKSIPV